MDGSKITEIESEVENQTEGAEIETYLIDDEDDGWADVKWSDDDGSDDTEEDVETEGEDGEEVEDTTPKPEKPEADEKPAEETKEAEPENADEYFEVKVNHETRKVSKDEAKALVQKGIDYDRIRSERDTMQKDYQTLKGYESFLNELKGEFPSIEALIDDTRARVLADKENISYADAMAKVKNQHPAPAKPEPERNQTQGNEAVQRFVERYPNVKAEEIPESVWAKVREGGDLSAEYAKYESSQKDSKIAELEAQIKTLKQNAKNEQRSAGSSSSSGKTGAKSMIASLWEDDD